MAELEAHVTTRRRGVPPILRVCRGRLPGLGILLSLAACAPSPIPCDERALQAQIEAAGVGGTVVFEAGRVYTLCAEVWPLAGQRWQGRGAVLRRFASPVARLVEDVPAGATEVAVEDATGFAPGQLITPIRGTRMPDGEGRFKRHRLLAVEGQRLRFRQPLGQGYRAGDAVIVMNALVRAAQPVDGLVIDGLVFDGNARSSPEHFAWQRGASLGLIGRDLRVAGCRFEDSWGDALQLYGAVGTVVWGNDFDGGAGAALHLSGSHTVTIEANRFARLNRRAAEAEHSEAAITFSAKNAAVHIRDNTFEELPAAAVGSINAAWTGPVQIERNRAVEVDRFVLGRFKGRPQEPWGGAVEVVGNHLETTGPSTFRSLEPAHRFPALLWQGNVVRGGGLVVRAGERLTLAGNHFEGVTLKVEDVPTDALEPAGPSAVE